jgi:8-oxo-dGTP pyrophosphatase MutT (NUDIX family)
MPETRPPIELQGLSLAELQTLIDERRLPPVDQWNPARCGHSGMRIARDGTWFHEGAPIRRPEMVRLFSTVLRREPDGRHVLVTPAEKLDIDVESTPFRAIDMRVEGIGLAQRIGFALDSGDAVVLGPDHPLRIVETPSGPSPRLLVRHGLEAELTRSVYYELAELALEGGDEQAGVWSGGAFFPLKSTRPALAERLREALSAPAVEPPLIGDYPEVRANAEVDAAVLIAITDRPDPGVVLTVRREHLRTHAGQIAFPGGRLDPGEDAVAAALREAHEEILLDPAAVEIVGTIEAYRTVTGYAVTPVIGVIPPDLPLEPHEHEVADWFEAPLDFLLDPANQQRRSALFQGVERHYYEIMWNDRRIWGATAAMIVNLSRRLRWR